MLDAGCGGVVNKPFQHTEIVKRLQRFLGSRPERDGQRGAAAPGGALDQHRSPITAGSARAGRG